MAPLRLLYDVTIFFFFPNPNCQFELASSRAEQTPHPCFNVLDIIQRFELKHLFILAQTSFEAL